MKPNNRKCGVGVAFGAKIGGKTCSSDKIENEHFKFLGIRALDGDVTDRIEGSSLARYVNNVDIVSCSWGPSDDGKRVEGPGKLASLAIKRGITEESVFSERLRPKIRLNSYTFTGPSR